MLQKHSIFHVLIKKYCRSALVAAAAGRVRLERATNCSSGAAHATFPVDLYAELRCPADDRYERHGPRRRRKKDPESHERHRAVPMGSSDGKLLRKYTRGKWSRR